MAKTGKPRNIFLVWFVWPVLTLGIYTLVWYYKVNREARDFGVESNPGVSLCAILFGWIIIVPPFVSLYKTGTRIAQMQRNAGLEPTCNGWIGLLLVFIVHTESLYYQSELNKLWAHYGDLPEGSPVTVTGTAVA